MLDFLKGSKICYTNSERLETSARILLNDKDGTDSYGLLLYYMAYEEIAKAVYCLLIHFGKITNEEFIKPVFRDHEAKVFLFHEIFSSFSLENGVANLNGIPINQLSLRDLNKKHSRMLKTHRDYTMDLLYVNRKNGKWHTPEFHIENIKDEENKIREKILSLYTIYEIISKSTKNGILNGFRIINSDKGIPTISWDEI